MEEPNRHEQLELFPIPSPCVGYCATDNKGYCLGCFRSREERFQWLKLSPSQQREVIRLCRQRKYRQLLAAKNKTTAPAPDMPALPLFDEE